MNIRRGLLAILGLAIVPSAESWGQLPTSAKIETAPIELRAPDRYQINAVLEPIRRVTVTVPFDGILRSMEEPVGATVRERQELAQLDRTESAA
ncbi:efflux RND transporter periplasmic adaptor subunit, partial [Singulisphaera rosea]